MAAIGLLGVPANSSGRRDGVARAPAVLREAGIVEALRLRTDVTDYGDVTLPDPSHERDLTTHLIDPEGLAAVVTRVRDAVASILGDGYRPLVIGGDCPLLLGCLAAAGTEDRVQLLFVDGHEDAYLPKQSSTGEAADMELAFALGMADPFWSPEFAAVCPHVEATDVRILGPRDAGTLRSEGIPSLGDRLSFVSGPDLASDPAGHTRAAVSSLTHHWWFHLDLDVLSTEALPAIDYPQNGGLAWEDLDEVAAQALGAEPAGWDITIYNPDLDPARTSARRIVEFVSSALSPRPRTAAV